MSINIEGYGSIKAYPENDLKDFYIKLMSYDHMAVGYGVLGKKDRVRNQSNYIRKIADLGEKMEDNYLKDIL